MFLKYRKMEAAMEGGEAGGGADPAAAPEASGSPDAPVKPEGLEDSFWDATNGVVRVESLIKSYNDTKAAFSGKEETLREKIQAEMRQGIPETPEAYKIAEDLGVEVPEGFEIKFDDDDPMLAMWRDIAHEAGLSEEQFNKGISNYVGTMLKNRPDPADELKKLGDNGADRINRLDNLMKKHLDAEQVNELSDFLLTAKGVESLEKLILGVNSNSFADVPTDASGEGGSEKLTRAQLEEMMRDPRYSGIGRPRDLAYVEQVAAGFRALSPGKAKVHQHR